MPKKPTSALGKMRIMPSSIPNPALKIGTTSGLGFAITKPLVFVIGVSTSVSFTIKCLVASYESSVTNSSTSFLKVGVSVFLSLRVVNLADTRG